MQNGSYLDKAADIAQNRKESGASALAALADIQNTEHYVSEEAVKKVAEIFETDSELLLRQARFFHVFSTQAGGKYKIRCCNGPCCTARGRDRIMEEIRKVTGIREGEITSKDGRFSLEGSGCLQGCASGLIMLVNDDRYSHVTAENVAEILKKYQ
mgnify:CR=1 FL=1